MGVFLVIRLVIVVQGENAGLSLLPLYEPDRLFSACHIEEPYFVAVLGGFPCALLSGPARFQGIEAFISLTRYCRLSCPQASPSSLNSNPRAMYSRHCQLSLCARGQL